MQFITGKKGRQTNIILELMHVTYTQIGNTAKGEKNVSFFSGKKRDTNKRKKKRKEKKSPLNTENVIYIFSLSLKNK